MTSLVLRTLATIESQRLAKSGAQLLVRDWDAIGSCVCDYDRVLDFILAMSSFPERLREVVGRETQN